MESLNKINGMVERNQWDCFRKTPNKLHLFAKISEEKRQIKFRKPSVCPSGSIRLFHWRKRAVCLKHLRMTGNGRTFAPWFINVKVIRLRLLRLFSLPKGRSASPFFLGNNIAFGPSAGLREEWSFHLCAAIPIPSQGTGNGWGWTYPLITKDLYPTPTPTLNLLFIHIWNNRPGRPAATSPGQRPGYYGRVLLTP